MLRGHSVGGSRRLNGHWQSVGDKMPDFYIAVETAGYLRGDETGLGGIGFGGNFGRYQRRSRLGETIAPTTAQLKMQKIIKKSTKIYKPVVKNHTGTTVRNLQESSWYKFTITPHSDYKTHLYCYKQEYPWWEYDQDEDEGIPRTILTCSAGVNSFTDILRISDSTNNDQGSVFFGSVLASRLILDKSVKITSWPNTWIGSPAEKFLTDTDQTIIGYGVATYNGTIDPKNIACVVMELAEIQNANADRPQPFLNTKIIVENCTYQDVLDNGVFYD